MYYDDADRMSRNRDDDNGKEDENDGHERSRIWSIVTQIRRMAEG